jgi:Flp pilus assembly protein TadG
MLARLARLTGRLKNESGAILALTAILMIVFIGMAALAIDVGSFYQAQKHAQSAADAAALAAVNDLPTSPALATTAADNYVAQNYPGASTPVVTYPSTTQIKVVVNAVTPSFFGQIFGITQANVSATAIAGQPVGTVPAALFAMDSTCTGDGIKITGNNESVPGGITSNGNFSQNGSGTNTFGGTTFGGPNGCPGSGSGTFAAGPTSLGSLTPWPFDYSLAALKPACTQSAASFSFTTTSNTDAVYCATGNISISQNVHLPNATLIANSFTIPGNNVIVGSASTGNGLSLYETGTTALAIAGNGISFNTVFAPNAEVQISGNSSGNVMNAFIEAFDVTISGTNHTINGTGPPSVGFVGALQG